MSRGCLCLVLYICVYMVYIPIPIINTNNVGICVILYVDMNIAYSLLSQWEKICVNILFFSTSIIYYYYYYYSAPFISIQTLLWAIVGRKKQEEEEEYSFRFSTVKCMWDKIRTTADWKFFLKKTINRLPWNLFFLLLSCFLVWNFFFFRDLGYFFQMQSSEMNSNYFKCGIFVKNSHIFSDIFRGAITFLLINCNNILYKWYWFTHTEVNEIFFWYFFGIICIFPSGQLWMYHMLISPKTKKKATNEKCVYPKDHINRSYK